MQKIVLFFIALAGFFLFSCKKESFITSPNANLATSADSIKFDTVFTATGSVTRSFKIFNNNNQKLLISKVKLMGGNLSPFKINIDGAAVAEWNDIEVAANDSIYVFVTVTINPGASNLPFIISDSILINYNGNNRFVQLQAYGQKANFLNNVLITGNVNWTDTLPYVITGGVRIDTTATLTIPAGTKVYLHANAPFLVDGTLLLNGTHAGNVIFTSDRLDDPYRDFPAGWPGIYLRGSSTNSRFRFAVIKNAYQAVVLQGPSVNANPKLILQQCIIDNAFDAGLLCINSDLQADNSLISNCGNNIVIQAGGDYRFTHCTVAAYSTQYMIHNKPVLNASNFGTLSGAAITTDLNALFRNCIFWGDSGSSENEVVINKQENNVFNVTMDHCLYKAQNDPANTNLISVIKNIDPLFDSIDYGHRYFDFRITKEPLAPGIDKGILTAFPKDLDDKERNVGLPDMGSFEKQ
jgi:hypothetical protein